MVCREAAPYRTSEVLSLQRTFWRTRASLLTSVHATQAGDVANEMSAAVPEEAAAAEPDKKADHEPQVPADDKEVPQVTAGEMPALAAAQNGVGTAAEMNALAGVLFARRAPHHAGHTLLYTWNDIVPPEPYSAVFLKHAPTAKPFSCALWKSMTGVSSNVKQGKHVGNCMCICREGVLSVSLAVQQKLRLQHFRLKLQLIPQL